jgi:hypothetical protein
MAGPISSNWHQAGADEQAWTGTGRLPAKGLACTPGRSSADNGFAGLLIPPAGSGNSVFWSLFSVQEGPQ